MNRAIAVAEVRGPERALEVIDGLGDDLDRYHHFHATRANLLRRLGRARESAEAYRRAAALAPSDAEHAFLTAELATVSSPETDAT